MKTNDFCEIVHSMAETGRQMTHFGAAEGSAGNMSIFVRKLHNLNGEFQQQTTLSLPVQVPALGDGWVLVTGSGQRLRDLGNCPESRICALRIRPGGEQADLFTGAPLRPTIELNSHLAIHNDQAARRGLDFHAIVHVQPLHLVYLSHIERYNDLLYLNRRLMRWQPETIAMFPEGICSLPFQFPGAADQVEPSVIALRTHRLVLWRCHGTVSRSDEGVEKAADLVEYAETAAHYEVLNLQSGEPAGGLPDEDLRRLCATFGINQPFF